MSAVSVGVIARLLIAVCVVATSSSPVFAQVSASLTGIVTDASGAAVSDAAVTATHLDTGRARSVATDAAGRYRLPELAVGAYEVTVAKSGFQTLVRRGIHLVVGQAATLDARLEVGGVTEQVTVTGEVSPVSGTTTDISGLVGEQQIKICR